MTPIETHFRRVQRTATVQVAAFSYSISTKGKNTVKRYGRSGTIIEGLSSASSQEGSESITEASVQDSKGETPTNAVAKEPLKCLIFKVPAHVREVDERAYNPKVVSIGPFHHDEPGLRFMEAQKLRFYNRLLQKYEGLLGKDMEEPIFETRWMLPTIAHDLLMLENQLPMFVLQKIFELTTIKREPTLNMLALQFFVPLRPRKDKLKTDILETKGKYPHLLALFHSTFISRDHKKQPSLVKGVKDLVDTIEDIDILRDAGIIKQVKGGNEEVVNLLNSLSKHLEFDIDDCCITEKIEVVNRFYRSKWFRVLFILVLSKIGYLG
ncbi:upf0481 protein [Quercus suber]|uniref:Upf0481 protein n=1 Tax=Quercus suber TaxID=58331 RepID=A0AAW0IGB5_QUESU